MHKQLLLTYWKQELTYFSLRTIAININNTQPTTHGDSNMKFVCLERRTFHVYFMGSPWLLMGRQILWSYNKILNIRPVSKLWRNYASPCGVTGYINMFSWTQLYCQIYIMLYCVLPLRLNDSQRNLMWFWNIDFLTHRPGLSHPLVW